MNTKERRNCDRRELIYYLRTNVAHTGQDIGYIANVSAGGIKLISRNPIEPNTAVQLKINLPIKIGDVSHLKFNATSRWSTKNLASGYFESGFELAGVGANGLEALRRMISEPSVHARQPVTRKRILDVILSFFGLLILLPAFLVVGFILKLESRGPVLFGADRIGRFGRKFRMYKFRTMDEAFGENGPRITAHDDPRITRIGRFLRETKLNELPQLFNVLKGNMSLVGPRPEYEEFIAHYAPDQREVLSVNPGITSLASIIYASEEQMLKFRNVTDDYLRRVLPDKLRLDLIYVRNQSILLDLDILFQTMLVLIPRIRSAAPRVEDILLGPVRQLGRHLSWFSIDAVIALIAVGFAGMIWRSSGPLDVGLGRFLIAAAGMTATFSIVNWITGVQRVQWRHATTMEAVDLTISAASATLLTLYVNSLSLSIHFPPVMLLMAGILALIGFMAARFHRRILSGLRSRIEDLRTATAAGRERLLVVGAGEAAQLFIWLLRNNPVGQAFHVIGVVDDDLDMLGTKVHRAPVLGLCDHIPDIVRENDVSTILFAIHNIDRHRREYLLSLCRKTAARTIIAPDPLGDLVQRTVGEAAAVTRLGTPATTPRVYAPYDSISTVLHQRIKRLLDQARAGDTEGVATGLSQIEASLRPALPPDMLESSDRIDANLTPGDQASPADLTSPQSPRT